MAKINNVVRIIEFNNETEFYYQIENDLTSYMDEPDSRCYKLKNIQMPDRILYYSIQEIALINDLGVITINDKEYDIEEIKYVVDDYGIRHAEIYMD